MIIGLGYKARSGKDTVGGFLETEYSFYRTSFALPLKNAAREIFGLNQEQLFGGLKEVEDPFWKDTPRNILQLLGTECLRRGYADDVWIRACQRRIQGETDVVITDVRFPNEADAILSWGGVVVNVERPYSEAYALVKTKKHQSEIAMENFGAWDYVLENDGTLCDLYKKVDVMMEHLRGLVSA